MRTTTIRAALAAICVEAAIPSFGATYYKVGSDPGNTTSFEGNASSTVGWSITSGATWTHGRSISSTRAGLCSTRH